MPHDHAPLAQLFATYLDGMTPHPAAGLPVKARGALGGLGETLAERDGGTPLGRA